jgi:uncharacterized protein DUF6152
LVVAVVAVVVFWGRSPPEKVVGGAEVKSKVLAFATVIAGFLALAGPLPAHHAARTVYESRSVTLKGIVTNYEWSNPHAIVSITVRTDNGNVEEWHAEILPPAEMTQAGWTKETIKPGDQVTLTGRPGKNSQHIMWLEYLLTPDGRKLGRKP